MIFATLIAWGIFALCVWIASAIVGAILMTAILAVLVWVFDR